MPAQTPGKLTGGIVYALPAWFKPSFLDFREDVEEARKANRHVMLFLHLDECPYCARMLEENFVQGDNRAFMQRHFDVIGVNVRGASEVRWLDGKTYTERAFARMLKVLGTPTLLFLGPDGDVVLRLAGYREPGALRVALEYVQSAAYRGQPFAAYAAAREKPAVYALRDHPQLAKVSDFKGYTEPLAILFEDRGCADCARFHEKTLAHPDVAAELKKFLFVRLDTGSQASVIDVEGKSVTPAQWAQALGLSYRPALALYDAGRAVVLIDSRLYHYHFKERLRYVSGGYYKRMSPSQYSAARRDELLRQGVTIDYAE
ncbi:MAG: thioredoxin fold domain-containing protein [Burkholderiales bacterium]|nr:thioredoxin fold domain-containing protein [Burkholderiales bacterium]